MTTPVDPTVPSDTHTDSAALIVIGGGPAGRSAAAAYREAGGAGRVVLITAEDTPPYRRPPLSKGFLSGEVGEEEMPQRPATDYDDQDIELWLSEPVSGLDTDARRVTTASGREITYDAVVLATGCAAAVLPVDGGDHPAVATLRSLDDGRFLRTAAGSARRAVVIGSGFIGCEAAATLARRGVDVTMVTSEELPQLQRLGRDVAERIAGWLTTAGVAVVSSAPVRRIDPDGAVVTDDGSHRGDLVLAALGVTPNSALAGAAGLELSDDGRILVDASMATAVPGVFAAGDVVMAENATAGRRLRVEHWGEADRMGTIAGRSAAGVADRWTDVPGFWSTIGDRSLQYKSWGDGYDAVEVVDHGDGAFTAWYSADGVAVGVLTHEADDDYEKGAELIAAGSPAPTG
ncbi:NAD(P)/FAD-dependent oxidoreductase [Nakamurella deserti]|uniref:NAD(P)/FAD-dependent oxidoreductase n=1 Tax=Nakamurella deserti TaxID=2164074 RepID=UPI000DBE6777|nr:FAD-dependent oxidoreductase [Nakamurella deserti]